MKKNIITNKAVFFCFIFSLCLIFISCKKEKKNKVDEAPEYTLPTNTGERIELTVSNNGYLSNDIKWSGITNGLSRFYRNPINYVPYIISKPTDTTLTGKSYKIFKSISTPSLGYIQENTIDNFSYENSSLVGISPSFKMGYPVFGTPPENELSGKYYRVMEINGNYNIPSMTYVFENIEENPSIQFPDTIKDRTKDFNIPINNCDFVDLRSQDSTAMLLTIQAQTKGSKYFTIPASWFNRLKGSRYFIFSFGVRLYKYRGMKVNGKNFLYIYPVETSVNCYIL